MLLNIDASREYVEKAKNYRGFGHGIGFSIWAISIGVTIPQIVNFVRIVKDPASARVTNSYDDLTLPLTIGGEIGSLFQSRLYSRSDYFLRKAVIAYNNDLCKKRGLEMDLDHTLKKSSIKNGWYVQDGIDMSTETMFMILMDYRETRSYSIGSQVFREVGSRTANLGVTFILFDLLAVINGYEMREYRYTGIGLTTFGIINAIVSRVLRKKGLDIHNAAFSAPVRCGK